MSGVQNQHRHIPEKYGIPLIHRNSGEEGERANGEIPRKKEKRIQGKRDKNSIRCREDAAKYVGD